MNIPKSIIEKFGYVGVPNVAPENPCVEIPADSGGVFYEFEVEYSKRKDWNFIQLAVTLEEN